VPTSNFLEFFVDNLNPLPGSTWAQELIWLLGNNLNYDGAKVIQQIRAPLLELSTIFFDDHKGWLE
jgi:hypothetical protein